jgi:hypothetical protein
MDLCLLFEEQDIWDPYLLSCIIAQIYLFGFDDALSDR